MADRFKIGDKVRLKSGGVVMVVTDYLPGLGGDDTVICKWHVNGKPHTEQYPASALERVDD